ncbi:MAG TPA: hypothetical protein EYP85_06855 [Armatimonadetes bacterium]|nr:hypothetical protein [Armatimonadota bacterium]
MGVLTSRNYWRLSTLTALAILVMLFPGACAQAQPAAYVWVEGEGPAAANFEFDVSSFGKPGLLSGGKWLVKTLDQNAAKRETPPEGFLLRYDLRVGEPGEYEVWARLGFEWVRPSLEWRIGQGPWIKVGSDKATTNVMQLGDWAEVAWLYLGKVTLRAGPVRWELRYREPGPDGRMLIGLDCLALTKGHFVPEGRLRPGEQYDRESDREAASQVFELPAPHRPAERTEVKLTGLWQVARYDDPNMDKDPLVPVKRLPTPEEYPLRWMGIEVPKSLWDHPETALAHRVIYRTRVRVPAEHRGRGFYLHFSGTNWLVSVFVNGQLAGTHRGVWIPWDLDISQFVKPGAVNELLVAVKGPYYAIDAAHMKEKSIQRLRNRPRSKARWVRWIAPIYPSTKGDGNGLDYGLVNPVTLVSVGNAYTEDVFIKPSLAPKRLEVEVTVRNTTGRGRKLQVRCEAVYDGSNRVEKTFGPVEITVPAYGTARVTVSGEWANPKLWWPQPNPHLYRLRTTVVEGGKPLDVQEELFGFREVSIKGNGIYLNGVRRNLWCWVDVHGQPWTGEEFLQQFHEERNRFLRFSRNRKTSNFLPSREERLEFYDRHGIPGRLCSMIDGMYVSYALGDRVRDPNTGKTTFVPNELLWESFRRHLSQLTRAYRNHPSVIMYQVENELVYINGMNLYGAFLDRIEELMNEVVEAGRKNDPTRPYTVGGAGDLSGRLEINSPHYPLGELDYYPENAYTLTHYATKITRWPWKRKKPWVVGESAYANELRFGSYVAGDEAFRGTQAARRAKAKFLRMLYGGYRWAGVAGFFPWDNLYQYEEAQKIFSDLCVIPRKQTYRLFASQKNTLLFKVLNDTFSEAPVTFEWTYEIGGRKIAGDRVTLHIEPGFGLEQTLVINAPTTERRLEGTLTLKASQPGAEDYLDRRSVPVLPAVTSLKVSVPVAVLDRWGKLKAFLTRTGTKFEGLENLADLKGRTGLLLIGPDTLTPQEASGRALLSFAVRGGRVIVLEQEVPVAGSNLPVPLKPTDHFGGYAHPQALGTPLFKDLGKEDLMDWRGAHPTYKHAYEKPSQGARSLVECGGLLKYTALADLACGSGIIVVCQLRAGAKLGVEPAAEVLLRNLIETYANYRPPEGVAAVYAPGNRLLVNKVRATGVLMEVVTSLQEALNPAKYKVALVHASARNLRALNALKAPALAFQEAGGWIMLLGLDQHGIDQFNAFLGTDHLIRPFRIERVTLERPDFPLAATLGNSDLSMYSTEWVAKWKGLHWLSGDVYTMVIDGRDIAPFCRMPGGPADPYEYRPTFDDHDPYNFVNGLFNSDFWRYIRQIWIPEGGPEPLTFTLRRPETIAQINIWNNANYWTIKDLDIILDGDEQNALRTTLPDSYGLREVKLQPPKRVQKTITLQIRTWRERRLDRPDLRLVGIDNVQFLRAEPPPKAVFIDNVGGLVAYPHGRGGVFLNQIKFLEKEPNPENEPKKLNLMGVLLRNMGVGSRSLVSPP